MNLHRQVHPPFVAVPQGSIQLVPAELSRGKPISKTKMKAKRMIVSFFEK
jgi:hypothetical protein